MYVCVCVCVYTHKAGETQHQSLSPTQAHRTVPYVSLAERISRDTPHYTTNFLVSVQAMCQVFVGQDLVPPFITTGSPLFEYVDLPLSLSPSLSLSGASFFQHHRTVCRPGVSRTLSCMPPPRTDYEGRRPNIPHSLHTHKSADLIIQPVAQEKCNTCNGCRPQPQTRPPATFNPLTKTGYSSLTVTL